MLFVLKFPWKKLWCWNWEAMVAWLAIMFASRVWGGEAFIKNLVFTISCVDPFTGSRLLLEVFPHSIDATSVLNWVLENLTQPVIRTTLIFLNNASFLEQSVFERKFVKVLEAQLKSLRVNEEKSKGTGSYDIIFRFLSTKTESFFFLNGLQNRNSGFWQQHNHIPMPSWPSRKTP